MISEVINPLVVAEMNIVHDVLNPLLLGPIDIPVVLLVTFLPLPLLQRVQNSVLECRLVLYVLTFLVLLTSGCRSVLSSRICGNTRT